MRTTLDVPEAILKKAKMLAVEEGVPLREVMIRALKREVTGKVLDLSARKQRAKRLFAALDKARNTKPIGRLNRTSLYDR